MRNLFNEAGRLAMDRKRLAKKLMNKTLKVEYYSDDVLLSNMRLPSAAKGLGFLVESIFFFVFVVILSWTAIKQRSPEVSRAVSEGMASWVRYSNITAVSTLQDVKGVLTALPVTINNIPSKNYLVVGGTSVRLVRTHCWQRPGVDTSEVLFQNTATTTNQLDGDGRVTRTTQVALVTVAGNMGDNDPIAATEDAEQDLPTKHCLPDVDLTHSSDSTPFVGPLTGHTFIWSDVEKLCVGGLCATPLFSAIGQQLEYPSGGYVLMAVNGSYWALRNASLPRPPAAQNSTLRAWNYSTQFSGPLEVGALIDDFLDPLSTRLISIELNVLNPFRMSLGTVLITYEFPSSGGVFSNVDVTVTSVSAQLVELEGLNMVFLLVYAVMQISLIFIRVVYTVIKARNDKCIVCNPSRNDDGPNADSTGEGPGDSVVMFNCLKCRESTEVKSYVTKCSSCGAAVPSLIHKCFRKHLVNPWTYFIILNMTILILWYVLASEVMPLLRHRVKEAWEVLASGNVDFDGSAWSFRQLMELTRTGFNFLAVTIALTFVALFGLCCRPQSVSGFVRVLYFGLPTVTVFLATMSVTFVAFAIAFHVAVGYSSKYFRSFSAGMLATFRMITVNAEWSQNDPRYGGLGGGESNVTATLLFLAFIVVIVLIMMNLLPAILTHAWKEAMSSPHYDAEVLSLWVMLKPLMRALGLMKEKRERRSSLKKNAPPESKSLDPKEAGRRRSMSKVSVDSAAIVGGYGRRKRSGSVSSVGSTASMSSSAGSEVSGERLNAIEQLQHVLATGGDILQARQLMTLHRLAGDFGDYSCEVSNAQSALSQDVTAVVESDLRVLTRAVMGLAAKLEQQTVAAAAAEVERTKLEMEALLRRQEDEEAAAYDSARAQKFLQGEIEGQPSPPSSALARHSSGRRRGRHDKKITKMPKENVSSARTAASENIFGPEASSGEDSIEAAAWDDCVEDAMRRRVKGPRGEINRRLLEESELPPASLHRNSDEDDDVDDEALDRARSFGAHPSHVSNDNVDAKLPSLANLAKLTQGWLQRRSVLDEFRLLEDQQGDERDEELLPLEARPAHSSQYSPPGVRQPSVPTSVVGDSPVRVPSGDLSASRMRPNQALPRLPSRAEYSPTFRTKPPAPGGSASLL